LIGKKLEQFNNEVNSQRIIYNKPFLSFKDKNIIYLNNNKYVIISNKTYDKIIYR
jgi:hypothetical protein